jgi:hypothetical protein
MTIDYQQSAIESKRAADLERVAYHRAILSAWPSVINHKAAMADVIDDLLAAYDEIDQLRRETL